MPTKKVKFKILRYKPGRIDPPRFQEFDLEIDPKRSVLDGLEMIRLEQDATLMYADPATIPPAAPVPVR